MVKTRGMFGIGCAGLMLNLGAHAEAPNGRPNSPGLPEAEFQECRNWYQGLGLEPLKDLPFIRVATGGSFVGDAKNEENTYLMAFLGKERQGENGAGFEVLTLDRRKLRFLRTAPDQRESQRVGYEVVGFEEWLPVMLEEKQDGGPPRRQRRDTNLTEVSPFSSHVASSPAMQACHLAMLCEDKGLNDEARALMARVPTLFTVEDGKDKAVSEALRHEFGHVLIWKAVLACDDPANPRSELLRMFERMPELCPESRHVERARGMAALLRQMIEQDKAHAEARAEMPFEKLDREGQIKDLIFRLRDQDGAQWGQPGACSVFGIGGERSSPADQLAAIGFEAVPHLIEAMLDENLTYSVEYHRDFYFSHRVLRVGEAAQQVIEKITGRQLRAAPAIRIFGEDPEQFDPSRGRVALQEAARKWWREFEAKGERQFLIDEVSAGGEAVRSLVARLIEKYPDEAPAALRAGLKAAKDDWSHRALVWAAGDANFAGSEEILREVIREDRFGEGTLVAIQWLKKRGRDDALDLAIALLDQEQSWKKGGWMDEMPAEDIVAYLLECAQEKTMRAILERLDRLPLAIRTRVPGGLSTGLSRTKGGSDEDTLAVAEEILVRLSEDLRWHGDVRVRDLATEALANLWEERYEFDPDAPVTTRNRQSLTAANRWREAHGEVLLRNPERVVKPMSTEEFRELRKRFEVMETMEDEAAFAKAVMKAGVAALPQLEALERGNEGRRKVVAGDITRAVSNRIEEITVVPEGRRYQPVEDWRQRMLGRPLTGDAVVELLAGFYRQASKNGENVRGINFEGVRHDELHGVDIRIELVSKERPDDALDQWNGSERVYLGRERVHWGGYGGMASKDDPKESEELAAGIDKVVGSDPRTPYEIRWQLIGWWHD